ncbi:MAG: chromate transporter [Clostridia bacterium]|nr:chromate transporter [Clostridia bacterium]
MIFLELFLTFFKIGAFTFGGGYAMLPLIQAEVTANGWISEEAIVNFIAVSESTPGPFAINMATYVGSELGGVLGSLCATLGVVMPSFVIILIVAKCFEKFKTNRIVKGCMSGLKPAAIGLIGAAVVSVGKTVFFPVGWALSVFSGAPFYLSLAICAVMAVAAFKKVHPILIICASAAIGIAAGYLLDLPL